MNIEETRDQKDTSSKSKTHKSGSDEELFPKSLDTGSDSPKGNEAVGFIDNEEIHEDKQNIPKNSEMSGIFRVSKDVSDDPEKKITMVDFAGQYSYYASHQIFLSPRVFFILVLNMEKKFDDKVGEEVCCQEGSVYGGWTHRDYLTFWANSIHQYSSEEAPVILVATHAENKTEQEVEEFFFDIWKTLETEDKSLQGHLDKRRKFAVGFHDSQSIEKIKESIVKVVQNLGHWGEKLPYSWAMFEKFFQEKKKLKIICKEKLMAFNQALPQNIKLERVEDINTMLQFFHDIREILHFNQKLLGGIIIIDVQWFADAFKNVITDKKHAEEDLYQHASEWCKFSENGELGDTLLSAIWEMNNNGYMEHKEKIMLYMEKLLSRTSG
ncbi:probable serine/threonine-protein kinase pats1 [Saccostrea cucullata]|uniref:probable serine/threonine-protein kinase pats1 n=1 Tax=Saccostrea cuccullata TaxID=36930 RepID=UPI002ED019AF